MKKYLFLTVLLIVAGCAKQAVQVNVPDVPEPQVTEKPAIKSDYLLATGIGDSEQEARRQAVSEMSRIFESRVFTDTVTTAKSFFDSEKGENFQKKYESNIKVISSVRLKGVKIRKTWHDRKRNSYYAIAELEKSSAEKEWTGQIRNINSQIKSDLSQAGKIDSPLLKLKPLNSIMKLWVEKQVVLSRLRVLGSSYRDIPGYSIEDIYNTISEIRNNMRICFDLQGKWADKIQSEAVKALAKEGFSFVSNTHSADVTVSGKVSVISVSLNRKDWKFARATALLEIVDTSSQTVAGQIAENARAAHLTASEADTKAIKKVSGKVANKLVEFFGH